MNTTTFTKKDVVAVFICVGFLFANLGAINRRGRAQVKALVCQSNLQKWGLIFSLYAQDNDDKLPQSDATVAAEVARRYPNEDFALKGRVRPRVAKGQGGLKERVKRIKTEETLFEALPGLDCGLCGAPTCRTFAKDVTQGRAQRNECVFFSDKRINQLRKTYLRPRRRPTKPGP